jgi:hypothetical protein
MKALKVRVQNGHIAIDEPTTMPDGTEVEVVLVDEDGLDEADRARLHAALAESEEDIAAGRLYPAEEVLAELAARRHGR